MEKCRTCYLTNNIIFRNYSRKKQTLCESCKLSGYRYWLPDVNIGDNVIIKESPDYQPIVGCTGQLVAVDVGIMFPYYVRVKHKGRDVGWWVKEVEPLNCIEVQPFKYSELVFTSEGEIKIKGKVIDRTEVRSIEKYVFNGVKPNSRLLKLLVQAGVIKEWTPREVTTFGMVTVEKAPCLDNWEVVPKDIDDDVIIMSHYVPGVEKNIRKGRIAFNHKVYDINEDTGIIGVSERFWETYRLFDSTSSIKFFKALFKGINNDPPTPPRKGNDDSISLAC